MKTLLQYFLGTFLVCGVIPSASAVILPPTDDTSGTLTFAGKPPVITKRTLTSLNGSGTTLPVSKTRTAFIRFAVEETGLTAATVEKARLTLYFPSVTKVGDVSLQLVTQDWEETFTGPTRTHPNIGSPFLTIPAASVIKRQFVIVDVTQQVKDWLTNPGSNFGIAMASPDGLVVATVGAKEGSASGYPPLLEIEGTGATSANTPNAIVKRDGDGSFVVGTITGALIGNATSATTAGSATNFTGQLAGDVTGFQGATVIANNAITSAMIAPGAVGNLNLANSGVTITAGNGLSGGGLVSLGGSINLANTGVLSLTGGGGITVSGNSGAFTLGSSATSENTAGAIVARDVNGDFSAGKITASSFSGNGSALTGITPRFDRQERLLPDPTGNNTDVYKDLLVIRTKDLGGPGCYVISVSTSHITSSVSNSQGTFAVAVDDTDVSTLQWFVNVSPSFTDDTNLAWTTIANNVAAGSVIKFRFKQNFNAGTTGIRVTGARLTIDGVPQSYVVE